jgi:hypothetical protein
MARRRDILSGAAAGLLAPAVLLGAETTGGDGPYA